MSRDDPHAVDARIDTHSIEIKRVLDSRFRLLRFPPALEALFEARQRPARDRQMIVMGLISVIVQNLFLMSDFTLVPDVFRQALTLRMGWSAFALLSVLPLALRPPVWLRESLVLMIALGIVGVILYLCCISHAPNAIYHPIGMVLIPMFVCIACRLRFWYALTLSLATLAGPALFLPHATELEHVISQTFGLLLLAGTIFTILASYRLEHQERVSFLLGELDRVHRDQLTVANQALHDLTTLDPLTGIYNRRQFEAALNMMWKQGQDSGRPLGLLMIDVDAFKPYNDRYGHPEGDACLKRIAVCLTEAIHREGTIVARIGGDEFAAIGLGLDHDGALALATAMHASVSGMAIPHHYSPVAPHVSLSIGAASLRPHTWDRAQALMDLADRAVYSAKAAGRNCVRGSETPKPVISLVGGRALAF